MTNYTPLADSTELFFRLPSFAFDPNFLRDDIKKKIPARDTSITYHREYEEEATLIYKGKPCTISSGPVYLRIQRFNNDELVDTKFICVDFTNLD